MFYCQWTGQTHREISSILGVINCKSTEILSGFVKLISLSRAYSLISHNIKHPLVQCSVPLGHVWERLLKLRGEMAQRIHWWTLTSEAKVWGRCCHWAFNRLQWRGHRVSHFKQRGLQRAIKVDLCWKRRVLWGYCDWCPQRTDQEEGQGQQHTTDLSDLKTEQKRWLSN